MKQQSDFKKRICLMLVIASIFLVSIINARGLSDTAKIIGADKLHASGITGGGQTVCIIDDGTDYTHPNLGGCAVTSNINDGSCDKVLGGYDYGDDDSNPYPVDYHGTKVSGIIASNDSKYAGIARNAKLVSLKVFKDTEENPTYPEFFTRVENAMKWCIDNSTKFNITIISASLGDFTYNDGDCPDLYGTNISGKATEAISKGIAVIFAAGNEYNRTGINFPACLANVTAVGSVNKKDKISDYTNFGNNLDLLAPGDFIKTTKKGGGFSTFREWLCELGVFTSRCTIGTSFATPHVAGAFALIKQYDSALKPHDIERLLKDTGKNISDSVSGLSFKRIDLLSALNVLDWPTDHHDYRRTGFTLLKGDVNKAADIDASNIALKDTISSDILIRPSVADLDGNGHQEVVTVMYELSAGGTVASNTEIHAVERKPKIFNRFWMDTSERWKKEIPTTYPYLPPTLANIDTDTEKEVLVGLKNGTLIAYDVTNNGWGVTEKWRYNIPEKYSVEAGMSFVRYGGGTAVTDIDLDGNYEVITADAGQSSAPDWPGEVYIIDGTTGSKEGNATFGEGGAFGSVSVANVDSDDNPEIIVPSFYGVFVYDYNTSAPNKLTKKCDTTSSGGVIDGSVVIYDVDRDNQYELIYTTANQFCHASKSCSNRLYIKNAQTCADESPFPVSLSVYSRVTPTIANLDSDSNYEIVISGRLNTQTEDGKIIAYDATTGSQEWSYDDGGTLKTAFVAPDIADMNGDGRHDIIFGENNGTKVHIVNSSGDKNFTYNFNAFVDSALAIADIDGDGKAEIALKREGSPIGILVIADGFNQPPQLGNISNRTGRAGELIDLNASGEIAASDPDGNALIFSFSSPFNGSGKWQTTVNDTGNYSIMVEVSDGSLTDFAFIDVYVFNQTVNFVGNFSDGGSSKLLNYTAAANKTISVRLPKNATIIYSRLRLEGEGS